MIVLDTHIWVWHASGSDRLTREQRQQLRAQESEGLGVSVISCWEVAKLVEYDRLELTLPKRPERSEVVSLEESPRIELPSLGGSFPSVISLRSI